MMTAVGCSRELMDDTKGEQNKSWTGPRQNLA